MISSLTHESPIRLSRRIDPSAVSALFAMTVGRQLRGRRLLVFSFLYSLPILVAVLAQRYEDRYEPVTAELTMILAIIPQTLLPMTALIYASGMIQDEIEEQTLTYLLVRPLPRSAIYAVKLAATLFVTAAITAIFTTIAFFVVYQFDSTAFTVDFLFRIVKTIAAMLLALAAYGALFGLVGLFLRRALVAGIAYIILFEGVPANIDFIVRKITIMYQFRVLTIRLLDLKAEPWNIDLKVAPDATRAALNLAIAALVMTVLGGFVFARKEFRVKTPEGT